MKALITDVKFQKEYDTKFGKNYSFKVTYNGRTGYYSSKSKDQNKFVAGQEAEFTEETKTSEKGTYIVIKPPFQNRQSNFGKALNKEKSRYSGFAVSYAKDLVVADKLDKEDLPIYATMLFDLMVELDKSIEL
jgi:hypothetical protein